MAQIPIACIQMGPILCTLDENVQKAVNMIKQAAAAGARLMVLPEVFSTGFCYDSIHTSAESISGSTVNTLLELSRECDCIIVTSIMEKEAVGYNDDTFRYYNLGICVGSGEILGTYRKTHLFSNERHYFSPGGSIAPIRLVQQDLTLGLEICYEMRFPEVARKLCLAGSDILITVAQFPKPRQHVWRTLAIARAIENQIPHIACNCTGEGNGLSYFGASLIVNAAGEVVQEAGEEETILSYILDTRETSAVREAITVFRDRREDLYHP